MTGRRLSAQKTATSDKEVIAEKGALESPGSSTPPPEMDKGRPTRKSTRMAIPKAGDDPYVYTTKEKSSVKEQMDPPKLKSEKQEEEAVATTTTVLKRGRGRPKKSCKGSNNNEESAVAAKRSKISDQQQEEEMEEQEEEQVTTVTVVHLPAQEEVQDNSNMEQEEVTIQQLQNQMVQLEDTQITQVQMIEPLEIVEDSDENENDNEALYALYENEEEDDDDDEDERGFILAPVVGHASSSNAEVFQVASMPPSALLLFDSNVGTSQELTFEVTNMPEMQSVLLGPPMVVDKSLEKDGGQLSDSEIELQTKNVTAVINHVVTIEMNTFLTAMEEEDIAMHQGRGGGGGYEEISAAIAEAATTADTTNNNSDDDISSDDYANDADYELDDDEDDEDRKKKKKKMTGQQQEEEQQQRGGGSGRGRGGRGRGGRGRGRGRGRGGSRGSRSSTRISASRPDPFNTSDYKKRSNDPADLCPPPPPKKLRGGRRTMMKEALSTTTNVPEGDVQLACLGLKGNEITKKADIRSPTAPFTGSVFTPLMRSMFLYEESWTHRIALMRTATAMADMVGNSNAVMELIRTSKEKKPFQLNKIVATAMMNYAARCAFIGRELDCKAWLMELGKELFSNPRFRELKVREMLVDPDGQNREWEEDAIYFDDFAVKLDRLKNHVITKIQELTSAARQICNSLKQAKARLEDVRKKKFFVQEKYQLLFQELSSRDSKFDEMSITGVRCIKMLMDGPYFKSEDALLTFQPPIDDMALAVRKDLPFHAEKQKWTSKDLQALKQIIKECVLAKRIDDLNSRYLELLSESDKRRVEEMSKEGKPVDVIYQAPQKRRRGRPTKEETSQRDRYGIVYPVILRIPNNNIIVAYSILPKQLSEWRTYKEKRFRNMSFDTILKEKDAEALIDWDDVSLKLMIRTKKLRLEADCQLTYKHEVDPSVNSKRLTLEETKKIKDLYQIQKKNWDEIAAEMNGPAIALASLKENTTGVLPPLHTPYQYFSRYISRVAPPTKPEWDEMMDEQVKTGLAQYPAHWRKVAAIVGNEAVTKKVVVERYKKAITPLLKVGPFSRVEDCLLLLTIQRLQAFMSEEGHFGSLLAYLPWRYETTWRDRAHNLFNDWIVPWTLEEDRLLLELAETMNRNWQKISEQFTSFKNRKGCLTRFKILDRNLKNDKNSSLEEYHEAYAMTRYNVFQYRHLKEILILLKKVQKVQLPKGCARFLMNPNRDKAPTESELQSMLVTYDRTVLNDTIVTMEKYVLGRDEYWETWMAKNGDRKRTFDRRTFHPDNPKSVASAVHIRGLKLKPKTQFNDLNDFEQEIYLHFGRFSRTKELSTKTKRPYLPPASFFCGWKSVQRIIDDPNRVVQKEKKDEPCSKKWMRLMNKSKKEKVVKKKKNQKRQQRKKKKKYEDTDEEEEITTSETEDEEEEDATTVSGSE